MVDIDKVRKFFATERFAALADAEILTADAGYAKCRMKLGDKHRNGMGAVMGGAIYTLADFAFAVASNVGRPATVTKESTIRYLRGSKGKTLYAEARCESDGPRTSEFRTVVTDDLGAVIAECRATGAVVGKVSILDAPKLEDARYRMAIFDLDGTILSTLEDLAASVNHALAACGLPGRTVEEVRSFVGNGFANLIARSVPEGTPDELREQVGASFRAHYAEHSMDLTRPYDGICEVFEALRRRGVLIAVLSNKGDSAVQPMMQKYFSGLLDAAYGERPGIRRKPAPDAIDALLAEYGIAKADAVYIGDSEVDLETAANAGLSSLIVSWGFRTPEHLRAHGAGHVIGTMAELQAAILGE